MSQDLHRDRHMREEPPEWGVRSAVKAMKPVMEVLGQRMHLLVRAYEDALRVERERRQQIRDSINAIGGGDE